jgi:acyl carrier protein
VPTDEIVERIDMMIRSIMPDLTGGIALSATFEDLGMDSLGKVDLAANAEDEFHIKVADEALDEIVNVGDLVRYVADRVS